MTGEHGGTITVDSEPGAFTEFTVRLPPQARGDGREGGMSVSILIVDDETDVADLYSQHFRHELRQGLYVLHFEYSAEEALEKLGGGIEPQLIVILSDINMPGMDGLALLRQIKNWRPELTVMIVTAYGDDERRRRAENTAPQNSLLSLSILASLKQAAQAGRPSWRADEQPAKILAVDDEADFELLLRQRFRRQIRAERIRPSLR